MNPSPSLLLFIKESSTNRKRVVQVRGLPCTLGSSDEVQLKLWTPGIPAVRLEQHGEAYRVVDGGGNALEVRGQIVKEAELQQGATFAIGQVEVRFFIGTIESLRAACRRARQAAEAGAPAPSPFKLADTELLPTSILESLDLPLTHSWSPRNDQCMDAFSKRTEAAIAHTRSHLAWLKRMRERLGQP